jgi:hypothetical protein
MGGASLSCLHCGAGTRGRTVQGERRLIGWKGRPPIPFRFDTGTTRLGRPQEPPLQPYLALPR